MAELMDPAQLLEILEGNRRVTLRTVKAFSEQDLFHYATVEPMRPFAAMVQEFLRLEECIMRGITTGKWHYDMDRYKEITTAPPLLEACESVRQQTRAWWPKLTAERGRNGSMGSDERRRPLVIRREE